MGLIIVSEDFNDHHMIFPNALYYIYLAMLQYIVMYLKDEWWISTD